MTVDLVVARSPITTRKNLLANPSIENIYNWQGDSSVFPAVATLDTEFVLYGTYSGKFTATSNGLGKVQAYYVNVLEEDILRLSIYVRTSRTQTFDIGVQCWTALPNPTYLGQNFGGDLVITANTWTRIDYTPTLVSGTQTVQMGIRAVSAQNGDSIWIDGALLEKSSTLNSYFDGDTEPSLSPPVYDIVLSWDGTANESASTLTYKTRTNYSGVNSINFTGGRMRIIDTTAAGRCTLEIINPSYFPEVGEKLEVFFEDRLLWIGYVADSLVKYGLTAGSDLLTITAESYLGRAGRAFVSVSAQTSELVTDLLSAACTAVDLVAQTTPSTTIVASHAAYEGSLLPYIQRLQMTSFGNLKENGEFICLVSRESSPFVQRGDGFTDTDATPQETKYFDLKFATLSDNAYDSVRIDTEVDGSVYVGTNSRTFVASTYNATESDATTLANLINDQFSASAKFPTEVSFEIPGQSNGTWALMMDLSPQVGEPDGAGGIIFQKQSIIFRNTSYQMIVLGYSFAGNPTSARATFYLYPSELYPNLILDDEDFGMLDYSTLGEEE